MVDVTIQIRFPVLTQWGEWRTSLEKELYSRYPALPPIGSKLIIDRQEYRVKEVIFDGLDQDTEIILEVERIPDPSEIPE